MEELKLKKFYLENHPNDNMGERIDETKTFEDLYDAIKTGGDVYDVIGIADSLIRDRLFKKLAEVKNIPYIDLYNGWLYS